nr:type IV secretion protein VirB7 [Lysobacter enzymogenes]
MNRYAEVPDEIPLHKSYVYYPSPMDGTLKNMLTRWSKDANLKLDYQHYSDFTLFQGVSQINTTSLPDAISQLNSAYSGHGVSISREGEQIVVRSSGAPAPASP